MAATRYYYSDAISKFLTKSVNEIVGELALASQHDINDETSHSWVDEITILQEVLVPYSERGSVYFEYNIPRMGRRADVIVIIDGIVFVLEFKTAEQKFRRDAVIQVWDYALDLKNFQEGSFNRILVPILIVSKEKDSYCNLEFKYFEDNVYEPLMVNLNFLSNAFSKALDVIPHSQQPVADDNTWAKSGYEPTPTIIEAAIALYEENTVEEITKHGGDIDNASMELTNIIEHCHKNNRKAICFITGVPGAGKTLIGLNTAIDQFNRGEKAIYLSGNFPLVEVLQEGLARDYVRRDKIKAKREGRKACTKSEAKSKVKAFIQMIHHYRNLYLEGTKVEDGKIIPISDYFQSHTDKAYIPAEHVAIFDEAQRAWTREELRRFMREKKGIKDFPYSEPEYLISCMDRQQDWGVVVCLVGNGQSINKGEAGLAEWIESVYRNYRDWDVYMSEYLLHSGDVTMEQLEIIRPQIKSRDSLHLKMSMRSFRSEKVSIFVNQLLALQKEEATSTLRELDNYPIVMTRSLDTAKQWLRVHTRGSERMGLLASSKAERLKAISINVRYQPDFVHWFLEDDSDIRSSNALEDTLTEFKVQGLEIDWACVAWDADLRLNKSHTGWQHYQLRSGTKWQNINKPINREYQINAYRVLLTRARQGMVIVVPKGDYGMPPDETRKPEWYDETYNYLKEVGIKEI
ncbi:DNA/RNA helicase domain-containing protein [Parabacteroides distasonis]|uniref:DNA/RNA helicase domain-containing protein n=1 Tax=Parabacteroides distasonis TaxID=823 RepID=UPI001896D7BB|nr:DNA/RNA helicase domain-containing protein [Parabacteroides distasonis]MDB9188765.1 DUF2075 domain-containing protein [Parabacteroides distasonis]MDB9197795.1 DUF2075 domain-containing protein [Parabacteroides distasonis]